MLDHLLCTAIKMLLMLGLVHMETKWRHVSVACTGQRGFEFSGHDGVFPLIADVLTVT